MAIPLADFKIMMASEVSAAMSKDAAAIERVEREIRSAQKAVGDYRGALAQAAAGARDAEKAQAAAQARLANATPADAKQRLAEFTAAQKASAAAGARESAAAGKLAEASKGAKDLAAARPELVALAKDAATAGDRAKALADQQQFATDRTFAFKGAVVQATAEVAKYAAIALAAAVVALGVFALRSIEAARNLRILGTALTGSAALGDEFSAIVNQLARQVPLAKDQITDLARELSLLRLGRRDMQAGLTAIAIVTSALGDAAGGAIKSIIATSAQMRRFTLGARDMFGEFTALRGTGLKSADVLGALARQMGQSVPAVERALLFGQVTIKDGMRALEAAAQGRLGKTIAMQMLSLSVQFSKARENIETLFDGIDIEPFLKGIQTILSIFDRTTFMGGVFHKVLTAAFSGVGGAVSAALPIVKLFMMGFIIGSLRVAVALKPIVAIFRSIGSAVLSVLGYIARGLGIDTIEAAKFAAFALAFAFGLVGVAIVLAFVPLIALGAVVVAGLYLIYKGLQLLWSVGGAIKNAIGGATAFLAALDWTALGGNLIDGLIAGIKNGAGALLASVTSLGSQATAAFKSTLGIASPSKVFMGFGENIAMGAAEGVDAGAPALGGAASDLGATAARSAGAGAATQSGGTIGPFVFNLNIGGKTVQQVVIETLNSEIDIAIDVAGAGLAPGVT